MTQQLPNLTATLRPPRLWSLRRLWHLRLKPLWRASRPFVMMAAAAAVVILGTIGFVDEEGLDKLDALYHAIQLFGFGGGAPDDPELPLQIARFLGPLIVGYAAVRGLFVLFREQLQLLWWRLTLREHIVIAGLGELGRHLSVRLSDQGWSVIAIEVDDTSAYASALRERGIGVIPGNAADPVLLRRAQVGRARHTIVSCGHDQIDINVAVAAREIPRRSRGVLTIFLNLGEPSLWRAVKARSIAEGAPGASRVEPFNLLDGGASLMVEEADLFASPTSSPKVVIAADGPMSQALALHTARVWLNQERMGKGKLSIDLVGSNAEWERRALAGRHPDLQEVCELTATELDLESAQLAAEASAATAVLVALSDEALGLAAGMALQAGTRNVEVPVTIAVREEGGGTGSAGRAAGLRVFGLFDRALGDEFLARGMNEVMAIAAHEDYLRARTALGEGPDDNPSLVPWDELPPSLRQSNRRAVDGIGPKLNEIGAAVVPAPLVRIEQEPFEFLDEEVEKLARLEHDRWVHDLVDEGWSFTEGEKDAERMRHPSLVGWNELSDEEKQKDRDAVLAIPAILERAGYAVVRLAR